MLSQIPQVFEVVFSVGPGDTVTPLDPFTQFLWNTFYHWRWILDDCERGYAMIGARPQRLAIPEFRKLCDAHERDCRIYIFDCVSTKNFQKFNDWMASASATLRSDNETLFYSDSGLQTLKENWFTANQARIEKLLR